MAGARVVLRRGAQGELERAAGFGLLNYLHHLEGAAKDNAPVRGGRRSFAPDGPVGGTLLRSIHSVVYLDGRRLTGDAQDENKQALPDYVAGRGVAGFVGSNSQYGGFVHNGTVKMPARPFLTEALAETQGDAPGLFRDGMRAALRRRL